MPELSKVSDFVERQSDFAEGRKTSFLPSANMDQLTDVVTAMEWIRKPPEGLTESEHVDLTSKLYDLNEILSNTQGASRRNTQSMKIVEDISAQVERISPESRMANNADRETGQTATRVKEKTLAGEKPHALSWAEENARRARAEPEKTVSFVRGGGSEPKGGWSPEPQKKGSWGPSKPSEPKGGWKKSPPSRSGSGPTIKR